MSSREEISSEKNETEYSTPREGDEEMSSSSSPSRSQEESTDEDPRRTTPRVYDADINNNDDDINNSNFDRDRTRIQIRDNFNNELRKLKGTLEGGDINEIYTQALENIKASIPDSDKFNLTFRKDKNGNYNGLIILNRFSKRKTPSVKSLPPPPPPGEPMRTMKKRTLAKMPKVVEPDDDGEDYNESLVLPQKAQIPSRTPRQRSSVRSERNTDRRGAVRRPKTDQALEATVKTLASEIEKINSRLLKMKMAKNDKQLMKAAKRSLKSMVGPGSNTQSQPVDYSNMFEKIYNEAYEASLNAGSNNNNTYTIEDLKHDAIKYFH